MKWEISILYFVLAVVGAIGAVMAFNRWTHEREKRFVRQKFQPYLSPRILERAIGRLATLRSHPERREMSVLFSDIRGFTGFSEQMSPQDAAAFLNRYFDRMSALVFKDGGTLDKFTGDGVMCFWGHPLETRNHALRATVCALEMVQAVEDLRSALMLPGSARFEIGIGVHTGPMIVGDFGSEDRTTYTVIGDNVNLGARLESVSRRYGARIVISEATYKACKDVVLCRELDTIQLTDGGDVMTIYEPLGLRAAADERRAATHDRRGPATVGKRAVYAYVMVRHGERRVTNRRVGSERLFVTPDEESIAEKYASALALYRAGDFDAASMAFDRVLMLNPADGPSRLMKTRIARRRTAQAEVPGFDPVYRFDEQEAFGRSLPPVVSRASGSVS